MRICPPTQSKIAGGYPGTLLFHNKTVCPEIRADCFIFYSYYKMLLSAMTAVPTVSGFVPCRLLYLRSKVMPFFESSFYAVKNILRFGSYRMIVIASGNIHKLGRFTAPNALYKLLYAEL